MLTEKNSANPSDFLPAIFSMAQREVLYGPYRGKRIPLFLEGDGFGDCRIRFVNRQMVVEMTREGSDLVKDFDEARRAVKRRAAIGIFVYPVLYSLPVYEHENGGDTVDYVSGWATYKIERSTFGKLRSASKN